MNARSVIIRPVISEKSYALLAANKYTFRVHDRRQQDAGAPGGRGDLRRARAGGAHDGVKSEAEAPRLHAPASARAWKKAIVTAPSRGHDRAVRGPGARRVSRWPSRNTSPPAPAAASPPGPTAPRSRRREPEKSLIEGLRSPAGATRTAASPRATAAAAPSASTARSTSSAARTACRRRSPRSSTTRTAAPTSRCSTTRTARSATSSRRQRLRVGGTVVSGDRRRHPDRATALPLRAIPTGTIVHNVELTPGRGGQIGPLRRHRHPARGEGGRARHAAPALGRDAHGAGRLPGHASARSATPSTRTSTSGRPAAPATRASARRRAAWR